MVCLHCVIPEMGSFPMNVAKYFCDYPFCKYLDSKTVLIYCPHPVYYLWSTTLLKCALAFTFRVPSVANYTFFNILLIKTETVTNTV